MKQLSKLVEHPESRRSVIADCVGVIDAEVKSKSGISGFAVKTAYGVVKAIKPGIITESVDNLIDEFVAQLQPHYEGYQQQGSGAFSAYLGARSADVAESMLAVTDRRAEGARNKTLVKAYQKLRPKAKEHVVAAIPRVGGLLDKHTATL